MRGMSKLSKDLQHISWKESAHSTSVIILSVRTAEESNLLKMLISLIMGQKEEAGSTE